MNPAAIERDYLYATARRGDLLNRAACARQALPAQLSDQSRRGRWAACQRNLGIVLVALGQRVQGSTFGQRPAIDPVGSGAA